MKLPTHILGVSLNLIKVNGNETRIEKDLSI